MTYTVASLLSQKRGQGHAKQIMTDVVNYADEHGYTLVLSVRRYHYKDSIALNDQQLEDFYAKFGFSRLGNARPIFMLRPPSQELQGS